MADKMHIDPPSASEAGNTAAVGGGSPKPLGHCPVRSSLRRNTSTSQGDDAPSPSVSRAEDRRVSFKQVSLGEDHAEEEELGAEAAHYKHKPLKRGDSVAMRKLVQSLYDRILGDVRLVQFFKDKDMARIFQHQMRLMTMMFGEEEVLMDRIQGIDLRRSHMPLIVSMGLSLEHWRLFVDHFKRMLDDLPEVPQESKDRANGLMEMTATLFRAPEPGELEKLGLGPDGRPLWQTPPENGYSGI